MSNNFVYNEVEPEALQAEYQEYDTVDFKLNHIGFAMLPNSLRIVGDVVLEDGAGQVVSGDSSVFYDALVGGHSFFDSFVVSTQNQGSVENFQNYARWVKMSRSGTMDKDDVFSSSMVCEMVSPSEKNTQHILQGYKLSDGTKVEDANMFIKPDICLNNMVGGAVSYNKTGEIIVSVRLARINSALYGADMDATYSYKIKNLKVAYNTVPDSPDFAGQVEMFIKTGMVQTINSSHSIIHVRTPITADSVVMSFISAGDDNKPVSNALELQTLPEVARVEYQFNDNTNGLVSYDIDNAPEMRHYTEEAFKSTGKDSFSLAKVENRKGYAIGFLFGYRQLINSKIAIVINSSLSSDVNAYVYLNGVLSL